MSSYRDRGIDTSYFRAPPIWPAFWIIAAVIFILVVAAWQ